ncbi:MAG: CAP domain-containing protein [Lachnospiraceae bacterium]
MKKRIVSIILCMLMAVLVSSAFFAVPTAAADKNESEADKTAAVSEEAGTNAENEGLNVTKRTVEEIRDFASRYPASVSQKVTYKKEPSLSNPYSEGILSDETMNSALNLLNQCRYIAGLDADVTLDDDYSSQASAATLVNYLNGELSHNPKKPSVLVSNDEGLLYDRGRRGAMNSNLAAGYSTLNSAIMNGWMSDSDSSNIERVGHRRWILNPEMGKVGFGATNRYYALYALDESGEGGQTRVAWPAQNMPVQYFSAGDAWSVSFGKELTASNIKVTLVRKSDNKKWVFSSNSSNGHFYVNNGYGQSGCIIFQPEELDSIKAGDRFNVTISGAESSDISYQVNFFDITRSISKASVTLSKTSYTYDGKAKKPAAVVKLGNITLKKNTDYTVSYENNTNAGTGEVIITGKGNYKGTVTATFKIDKADQTISASVSSSTVKKGKTVTINASSSGSSKITFSSGNSNIAKVDSKGTVTGTGVGTVVITINAAETKNYHKATKKLQLKIIPRTPSIESLSNNSAGITVKWNKISEADGYYVYRKKGSETDWSKVAAIKTNTVFSWNDKSADSNGIKYVYKVRAYKTVSDKTYTSSSSAGKTIYYLSSPSISGLTNSGKRTFKVTWTGNTRASGYQLKYASSSNFSGAKTKTFRGNKSVTTSVNELTKGKIYYVKIRAYKTVENTKYYSSWSVVKKVKISK